MKLGIDKIGFYTSKYYLDLATLAQTHNLEKDKFYKGHGQYRMSIAPPCEDIVTMAASAAATIIDDQDRAAIDTVIFATETAFDFSKAAGVYVHHLLGLSPNCRVIELKQACYAATCGIQFAIAMLHYQPQRKVLVLASDIARYQLHSNAESSQGCAAIAMLMSKDPRILAIEPESGYLTENIMDFWRPQYRREPFVNGRYSCEVYLQVLEKTWRHYSAASKREFSDHFAFCYHTPVPKLVEKAHRRLLKLNGIADVESELLANSLIYNREVGNCYTASLGLSFLSLLENSEKDFSSQRIGFYSYGSGCVGEFFSGIVQPQYRDVITPLKNQQFLANRSELTYQDYLEFFNFSLPEVDGEFAVPQFSGGSYKLLAVNDHKRVYSKENYAA